MLRPDMKTMQIVARLRVLLVSYFFSILQLQSYSHKVSYKIIHLLTEKRAFYLITYSILCHCSSDTSKRVATDTFEENRWPIFQKPYKTHHFYARWWDSLLRVRCLHLECSYYYFILHCCLAHMLRAESNAFKWS